MQRRPRRWWIMAAAAGHRRSRRVGIGYAASAQLIGDANGVTLGHQLGRIRNVVVDEKHVAGLAAIAVEQQGRWRDGR